MQYDRKKLEPFFFQEPLSLVPIPPAEEKIDNTNSITSVG